MYPVYQSTSQSSSIDIHNTNIVAHHHVTNWSKTVDSCQCHFAMYMGYVHPLTVFQVKIYRQRDTYKLLL